jgi:hypothetical protein
VIEPGLFEFEAEMNSILENIEERLGDAQFTDDQD